MVIATDRTTPFQMQVFGPPLPGFSVDKSVPVPIVTVRNISNGEVARQLPSAAAVKMAHHLDSLKSFLHSARVCQKNSSSFFNQFRFIV
jgi:hypothetical protein